MASRMLKELKSLSPWQWDTRVMKHPVGPGTLKDFEQVRGGPHHTTPGPTLGLLTTTRSTHTRPSLAPQIEDAFSNPEAHHTRQQSVEGSGGASRICYKV